jgi:hypothetical protein
MASGNSMAFATVPTKRPVGVAALRPLAVSAAIIVSALGGPSEADRPRHARFAGTVANGGAHG